MSSSVQEFAVYADLAGATLHVGTAHIGRRRALTTTFQYSGEYLRSTGAYSLSPDLPVRESRHAVPGLPGAFADSAPDRWGRKLITKRLRSSDRQAGRTPRTLTDVDFLLGVSDFTRQGALRYADRAGGPFREPDHEVPRLVGLPTLMRAADVVARDEEDQAAIKTLLDAGTGSLGGARPKASVRDGGQLLIAKFAHPHDSWDVMGWEKTALDLAQAAGISVPKSRLITIDGRHALLVQRFDRTSTGRIGYISAMTLLGAADGEARDYLEVAEAMSAESPTPTTDLAELWRRVVFYCSISNTDDHLRNLGFLRTGPGWALAPAFDLNPNPEPGPSRQTTVGWAEPQSDATLEALLEVRDEFGLDAASSRRILTDVSEATAQWRDVARSHGIAEAEIDRFAGAFPPLGTVGR